MSEPSYRTYQLVGILMIATQTQHESKRKLLDAALHVIRAKGYTATRVEDICEEAGLTKGSFFHHFESKEELALAAAEYWNLRTGQLFREAAYHAAADPVDRLLAYVDFRKALLKGALPEFTCLVGTMVQEVYETHPHLREACEASIWGHASTLEPDIAEAMRMHGLEGEWTARSLALHTQAVIQGAFILAKAHGGTEVAAESIDHLRRYLEMLFGRTTGGPPEGKWKEERESEL
jgi:TetR/AcrR family transcriptional regulator, transcriptional repressor for nem operon